MRDLKKIAPVFLFLVVLFIVFSRFYLIFQHHFWLTDGARDFLVAKNIWNYSDNSKLVPYAAFAGNSLMNSLLYYRLISLLGFFSDSYLSYQFTFCLIYCVSLLFSSLIISKAFALNKNTKLFFIAIIFSFTHFFWASIVFFQPNFAFIFLFLAMSSFLYAFIRRSHKLLLFGAVIYALSIHFHYAVLALFPWVVYVLIYLYSHKVKVFWSSSILIFSLIFILLNQILITHENSVYEKLIFFIQKLFFDQKESFNLLIENFFGNLRLFIGFSFSDLLVNLSLISGILMFLFTGKYKLLFTSGIIIIFSYLFLFLLINYQNVQSYYFIPLYFFLLMFSFLSVVSIERKWIKNILFAYLFSVLLQQLFFDFQKNFHISASNQKRIEVSQAIYNDLSKRNLLNGDFHLQAIDSTLNEENHLYYLFLSNQFKDRLLINRNDGINNAYMNLFPYKEKTNNIYLVCNDLSFLRKRTNGLHQNWCLSHFLKFEEISSYETIYISPEMDLKVYYLITSELLDRKKYIYFWEYWFYN